ncbi:MAG: HU family DNA-binding protein [Butyrivibrio sp.]|nr:HU family DNA-binding protein [Butyrivibrio sp.]
MNKSELIDAIAKETGLSKKDSGKAVDAFVDTVSKALKKKDKVQLVGFGTFETVKRAARTGKNPQTGAALKIPASTAPKFKPGKALKDLVNGSKK